MEGAQAGRRCELVTVIGDAGVGKSRLAAEVTRTRLATCVEHPSMLTSPETTSTIVAPGGASRLEHQAEVASCTARVISRSE
jgi:hypothetical protein